jgi:CDP-glucose 4,6-dehydratase
MFAGIYPKKRVLVTGHTGFKGSWLSAWLLHLGAKVAGFSLGVPTHPANFEVLGLKDRLLHFEGDIRNLHAFKQALKDFQPELVFHLAAQSLVRRSYAEPAETFETNALGTMNVLEGLRQQASCRAAVIITSDKCYRNREWTWGYRENDLLGGDDPYSASKACAELISQAYFKSFFQAPRPRVATARAGNVIGGGDWAPDRIVPDCLRAWSAGRPVKIRSPQATRPWQHVLEPLSGYLWLGARLWQEDPAVTGESFNFGPPPVVNESVAELIAALGRHWPQATWEVDQPGNQRPQESTLLKLCCDKAWHFLKWQAVLPLAEAIRFTGEWYRTYYEQGTAPMFDLTLRQIQDYQARAQAEGLAWTAP